MSDLTQQEARLAAALARIEAAAMSLPDHDTAASEASELEVQALRAQLDEERTTNAQLVERVKALKDRQENQVTQLEQSLKIAKASETDRNKLHQKLKATIEQLRDQVARLTEANRAMVGDSHLINTSMMVELEAMRSARTADVAEVDDMLRDLAPQIEENANA